MPFSSSSYHRPSRRRDFQIAIICALPLEYDAASLLVDEFWDQDDKQYGRTSGDMNKYRNGRIGVHNVVLMLLPKMGKAAVAGSTGSLRTSYPSVRIAFLVGVCGGVPSSSTHEALLGDVVVSDDIVEYDFGRQYPGKFIAKQTKQGTEGNLGIANKDIRSLVAYLKTEPGRYDLRRDAADFLKFLQNAALEKRYRCNYEHPGFHEDRLYISTYHHKHTRNSYCAFCHEELGTFCHEAAQATCEELGCKEAYLVTRHNVTSARNLHSPCPEIFIGRIASADTVMKSGEHRDQVAKQYDVIAFEMEGAGILDELPCVVVKGICDYADSHKNKAWQPFAAATAAAVLKSILLRYTSGNGAEPVVHNDGLLQDRGYLPDAKTSNLALVQNLKISDSAQMAIWSSLRDSIHDFTDILTADRRYELQNIKSVPGDDAVLIFTAQLDHQNRDRKGRSIASRLYSVLKSVRDFSITIETFISCPGIGALVWGSLKVTMLVIFSSIQYYEALSELFMKIGGLFPRWAEYQVFYKISTQLQTALCDFFASVIRYCTHVVDKVRNQWQTYFFNSFWQSFELEFQPATDDIRTCNERFKNELFAAKALADYQDQQLQVKSQKDSSSSRWKLNNLLLRANDKENVGSWEMMRNERLSKEKRQELLDSLSTHDYLTPLKQSRRKRHNSTAKWLFSTNEFDQWVKGTSSPVLWCSGKIGSGKTILTASVIDKILTTECSANVSVAFFFVRFDDWQSLKAEYILRSIIRQELIKVGLSQETEALLQNIQPRLTSGCQELLELLRKIVVRLKTFYIIVDGVDECEKSDRNDLLHTLSLLATVGSNTRLFLTGRDSVSREVKRAFPGIGKIFMSCLSVESDIAAYVEGAVQERLQSEDLIVGDPSLIEEIKKALREGADGMFLWVTFQIDELCAQHCDDDIRKAIVNLPQDLTETFNRVLGRILSGRNKDIARKTFQWVAAANKPLSLDELREAFSIEVGQEYSKPDRQPNEIYRITSWCENMVQVDEEKKLVQFAHHTVQQYLLQQNPESPLKEFHFNIEDADHLIGEICVTYLNFNDFKTTVARRRQPLRNISPITIAQTALKQERKSSNPLSIISNFKQGRRATPTNFDVVGTLASITPDTAETVGDESTHPFLKYASVNWIFHTTAFQDGKSRTWDDWRKMIIDGHGLTQNPWGDRVFSANDPLMLKWSYKARHYPLLRLITLSGGPSDYDRDQLMQIAAGSDDTALLDILLEGKRRGQELERACQTAVEHGHLSIVDRLLAAGADLNIGVRIDGKIHTALYTAAKHGDLIMVDRLVAAGAFLNAYSDIDGGLRTALYAATLNNDRDIVERLLEAGADIDFCISCDGERQTALYAAIKCGYSGMVERLLAAEANLHAGATINSQRQTALYTAARSGDVDVVNQLIEIGVDVDTPIYSDGELRTALYTAAKNGHLSTVSRLLSVGANTEDASTSGPTALYIAAQNGSLDIVEKLLIVGANANAKVLMDGAHQTVLYTATQGGYLDIVERLLAAGADPNTWVYIDNKRQTALSLAAQNGDLHIVEILLAAGGDMNVETSFGELNGDVLQKAASGGYRRLFERLLGPGNIWPSEKLQDALQAAAGGGQLDVVDRLLAAGADVNYVSVSSGNTRTALDAATEAGHQPVIQRLRDAGAYR